MDGASHDGGIHVLWYLPRYLARSEHYAWRPLAALQADPDIARVEVAYRTLTAHHAEFPWPHLTKLGSRSRVGAGLDYRLSRRLAQLTGRERTLTIGQARSLARRVESVDVVVCMFLWNAIELLPTLRHSSTPFVVHIAGSDITTAAWRGQQYLNSIEEVFERAQLVTASSQFLLDEADSAGFLPEATRVHHPGVVVPETLSKSANPCLRVLAVSRLHKVKGVDRTIRSFGRALRNTSAELRIIGDGPERVRLASLATELGLDDQVVFLGARPHADVLREMDVADIFVQHSVTLETGAQEGLGVVFLEASARAVPVVSTRSGGIPEAVLDGETGILVEPEDQAAMASALSRLAASAELRASMGAQGRKFVEDLHDARKQDARLASLLVNVTSA